MSTIGTIRPGRAGDKTGGRADYVRRITRSVGRAFALFRWLIERRSTRLALFEMSDEQLKDIGISRADAHREASRSFFDNVPADPNARRWG